MMFGVSVSAAAKWSARLRVDGSADAKPMGATRRAVLAEHREWLLVRIAAVPDLTRRALRAQLAERGVAVSVWAIWRLYAHAGITFEKSIVAAEQGQADIISRRRRWARLQTSVDPKRFVFIDETWAKTNMTRLHGRVPFEYWRTMTFVAALRCEGISGHRQVVTRLAC